MDDIISKKIIERLESKQRDCAAFMKKYQTRKQDDLVQYYEGGEWALKLAISIIKQENNLES